MHLLRSVLYCVHLFLIPRGHSPVCLCFGTLDVVTRCFLTSWGEVFWERCWEAGRQYFLAPLSAFVWRPLFFWLYFPPLILTLFLCDLPPPSISPVSVSATATQADLSQDREAEGQEGGGGQGRVPLRVEFSDNSLTYMDRLLLKKQRRYTDTPSSLRSI